MKPIDKANAFLKIADQFKLGHLTTESFHPLTSDLSNLVKKDVSAAHKLLQEVDRLALEQMQSIEGVIFEMAESIQKTLRAGNKVFMCGCGATGRLSLVLETLYRQSHPASNQVMAFMAGGDFALIKSVESFEDRVEYGERQLMELGFGPHDLLLSPTEGGETPFVIGATNKATQISSRAPYFLYCNPDAALKNIQRSEDVIQNPKIKKVNLTVGPMAISGSTRMQASTVLMLAIGVGLLYEHENKGDFSEFYQDFLKRLTHTNYSAMSSFTSLEAKLYQDKKFLNYIADPELAISILTDTTERSPTFSLKGFESSLEPGSDHSLSYLFLSEGDTSGHAWSELLARPPRALSWSELGGRIDLPKVYGFDISKIGLNNRRGVVPSVDFFVTHDEGRVKFQCESENLVFDWGSDPLFNHLMVKMLLNAHSTLIMGLLGRYEGNVMTWVRSSNNKLVDRSARYILQLLKQKNIEASYEDVVLKIFEESETLTENEPIVMKVLKRF
jgi:N-acetylmuramic acid 6-phosphate etherase